MPPVYRSEAAACSLAPRGIHRRAPNSIHHRTATRPPGSCSAPRPATPPPSRRWSTRSTTPYGQSSAATSTIPMTLMTCFKMAGHASHATLAPCPSQPGFARGPRTSARHCIIDFLRAHRAERLRSISADGGLLDTLRDSAQPPLDAALLASEASTQLRSALARLSAQEPRALGPARGERSAIYRGRGTHWITVGAAQVRVFRARRRLQRLLTLDIERIGGAVTEQDLRALTTGQARPAQSAMLWHHVGTCAHCEYRLRVMRRGGNGSRKAGAA